MGLSIWGNGVAILPRRGLLGKRNRCRKMSQLRCQVGYRSLKFPGKDIDEINIGVMGIFKPMAMEII